MDRSKMYETNADKMFQNLISGNGEDPMNWSDGDLERLAAACLALLIPDPEAVPGGIDAGTYGR